MRWIRQYDMTIAVILRYSEYLLIWHCLIITCVIIINLSARVRRSFPCVKNEIMSRRDYATYIVSMWLSLEVSRLYDCGRETLGSIIGTTTSFPSVLLPSSCHQLND